MTVYWAFESIEKVLNQDSLADQVSQLGDEEQKFLDRLRFKKRREEWLAGRLVLKRLLQKVVPGFSDLRPCTIQIVKAESGAPTLRVDFTTPVKLAISLSHSNGHIFCAASQQSPVLGVDLELIETRSDSFISDFFTQMEIEQIDHQSILERAFLSTLIWSEKEAVLKALAIGLKMDTRRIEIDLAGCQNSDEWQSNSANVAQQKNLRLLWRRQDSFVFTLCGENISSADLVQVCL